MCVQETLASLTTIGRKKALAHSGPRHHVRASVIRSVRSFTRPARRLRFAPVAARSQLPRAPPPPPAFTPGRWGSSGHPANLRACAPSSTLPKVPAALLSSMGEMRPDAAPAPWRFCSGRAEVLSVPSPQSPHRHRPTVGCVSMAAPTGVVWDAAPEPPRFIKLRRTNALRASAPKQWTPRSIARSLARSQDVRSLARSPAGRPSRRTTRAVSSALDCAGSPRTPITAEDDHAPCARKAAPRAGNFHGFQAFLFP